MNDFLVVHLDSIDKRLLEYFDQDDRCTAPWLPSQGDRGSCTRYISVDLSRSALEQSRCALSTSRNGVMDPDVPVENFLVVTAPVIGLVYLPAFVLRASAEPRRASRKTIVPMMASVIASATVFVSTMSTVSASRPRPLARTNRESVSLLTATTRLTRSSLRV